MRIPPLHAWLALLLLGGAACQNDPSARVRRIESLSETIGGPAAAGAVGDFLLENDRIRIIIHGRPGESGSSVALGGTILDADIQRPQSRFLGAQGLDQFFELGPMINLRVPLPYCLNDLDCPDGHVCTHAACLDERTAPPPDCELDSDCGEDESCFGGACVDRSLVPAPSFEIVRAESIGEEGALLRVRGTTGNIVEVISLLGGVKGLAALDTPSMSFEIDYELRPHENFVRVRTVAYPTGRPSEGDATVETMGGFEGSKSILGVLLGDLAPEADEPSCETDEDCETGTICQTSLGKNVCREPNPEMGGAFGAWLALLGGKLKVFVPGAGLDPWLSIRASIAVESDFFSNPVPFNFLAGLGDKVSYVIFSGEGDLQVPLASSNFTVAISNATHCRQGEEVCETDSGAEVNRHCLAGTGVAMTGILSVGEGDVASAAAPYYELRGIPTGDLRGVVLDQRTGAPVSDADVFVFVDPSENGDAAVDTYEKMVAANRAASKSNSRPAGESGIITHMRTDLGLDPRRDGDFGGPVPIPDGGESRYLLVARKGYQISAPQPVSIVEGRTTDTVIVLPDAGTLNVEIQDQNGIAIPGKITIGQCLTECATDADCEEAGKICHPDEWRCIPKAPCSADADCDPDEWCNAGSGECRCARDGQLPRELGGHWIVDGVATTHYTGAHKAEVHVPPGTYEVILSRGLEYSIDRQFVTIRPSQTTWLIGHIDRVVDTTGFVSADFHVHSANSPDSGVPLDVRIRSYVAEGVEFVSSSDHDVFTDYSPVIYRDGLERWIRSQVGVETSPLMLSHLLAFPMAYDELLPQNMASEAAFDWTQCEPLTIAVGDKVKWKFEGLEDLAGLGDDEIAQCLDKPFHSIVFDSALCEDDESLCRFQASPDDKQFEIQFSQPGTYTYFCEDHPDSMRATIIVVEGEPDERPADAPPEEPEVVTHNVRVGHNFFSPSLWCRGRTPQEIMDDMRAAGELFGKKGDAIVVLPHIYDYFNYYGLSSFNLSVSPNQVLQIDQAFRPANFSGDFDGMEIANGKSLDFIRKPTVSEVRDYNIALETITELLKSDEIDIEEHTRRHIRIGRTMIGRILERTIEEQDAFVDALEGVDCGCVMEEECSGNEAPDDAPCDGFRGIVEDHFRFLNHGVYYTALANSDSHDLYHVEAGMPRNYVRSPTDLPIQIDPDDINRAVLERAVVASYGPFIRFEINGQGVGETVFAKDGALVELAISVQSPLWFDVDRVEVYRNGRIVRVYESCEVTPDEEDCIEVPNDTISNLDVAFLDDSDGDAWYAVVAAGIRGKTLAPVYSTAPLPRFGFVESMDSFFEAIPVGLGGGSAKTPTVHPILPYALTNPIWVMKGHPNVVGSAPPWAERPSHGANR